MSRRCAPVVIFVYRRRIDVLLEQLRHNPEAADTDLFIFSDGYKSDADREDVLHVRAGLQGISGFGSVTVAEAETNRGLAASVIAGVSRVMAEAGRTIVLEDDLSITGDFLRYMNAALRFYENDPKVWSLSGYGANLPCMRSYAKDLYLAPRVCSWGWASWQSRWERVDWALSDYPEAKRERHFRMRFDAGGDDLYRMLELQKLGRIDSWAIRWQYSQFKEQRYTVYPKASKVRLGGLDDGKGTHNSGVMPKWDTTLREGDVHCETLEADPVILACFQTYYNLGFATKAGYLLKKIGGYRWAKKGYRWLQRRGGD